jgi:hypothetical protein
VSWSWDALTSVSNAGWIAYFHALSPVDRVGARDLGDRLAGVLAVLLGGRGVPSRAAGIVGGWAVLLALAWTVAGPSASAPFSASSVRQVSRSVLTAFREHAIVRCPH